MENLRELVSTAVRKPVQWREFSQKHGNPSRIWPQACVRKLVSESFRPEKRHLANANWRKTRRVKYPLLYHHADIHGMNSQKPRQKLPKTFPDRYLFIVAGEASRCQPSGRDGYTQKHGKNAVSICPDE